MPLASGSNGRNTYTCFTFKYKTNREIIHNFYIPTTPDTELKAAMLIYEVELSSLNYEEVLKLI